MPDASERTRLSALAQGKASGRQPQARLEEPAQLVLIGARSAKPLSPPAGTGT